MLKKMYLGLIIVILFCVSFAFAADESLTITTYYPSPYGVYKTLRLQPNDDQAAGGACANEGDMAYDLSAHQALVCNGTKWVEIGGGGISFTHYCYIDPGYGGPVCTNAGGSQGYCPSGYTQKVALGSWGACFGSGGPGGGSGYLGGTYYADYYLPPGGSCGSGHTLQIGNAYVCTK